jgi:outer membrane protein assembly factor BamB
VSRSALAAALLALCMVAACGGSTAPESVEWPEHAQKHRAAGPAVRVRWVKELSPKFEGLYRPVERSAPAIDSELGRIYVGSTERYVWAFGADGKRLYRYATESGVESQPALDAKRGELYVTTVRGIVHALHAETGALRWQASLGASVSTEGVLADDALYVVTDEDSVFALSRTDGSVLWRYRREPRAGLQVAGHAGITVTNNRLLTGFSDGTIVALSPGDGRQLWLVDTTLDILDPGQLERGFIDVDTTPVQYGDTVYAASFTAGFYAIDAARGEILRRDANLTGIATLSLADNAILLGSSRSGVICLDLPDLQPRWVHAMRRGAPGSIQVVGHRLYVTETRGALLALRLADGHEDGRLQTEYGFTGTPSLQGGRGFILGNAGTLFAFDY